MRILGPARADSIAPLDEGRAERLRCRILQGLLGCISLWLLAALLAFNGIFQPAGLAILLAAVPWAWAAAAWIQIWRTPWSPQWHASPGDKAVVLFLLFFAIPAAAPATFRALEYASGLPEALPGRIEARARFEWLLGNRSAVEINRVYHSRRDPDGSRNSLESEYRDMFQFSVTNPESARQILSGSGFSLSYPDLSEREKPFHPRNFPWVWLPFSLGSNLEVWRTGSAIAWIDPENRAVYVVLPAGWRPRR